MQHTLSAREAAMPVPRRSAVGQPTARGLMDAAPADFLTTPVGLVHDAVDAAFISIEAIEDQLPLVADAVRWHGDGVAGPQLDRIIRHAKRLVLLAALAAQMSGADLRELRRRDPRIATTIDDTCAALDTLLDRQEAGDSLGVADALTDHVAPALSGWRVVFAAIARDVRRAA
ncbi:MAG: hypothetical protein WCQ64_17300 [Acidobacteriota bacterium]